MTNDKDKGRFVHVGEIHVDGERVEQLVHNSIEGCQEDLAVLAGYWTRDDLDWHESDSGSVHAHPSTEPDSGFDHDGIPEDVNPNSVLFAVRKHVVYTGSPEKPAANGSEQPNHA